MNNSCDDENRPTAGSGGTSIRAQKAAGASLTSRSSDVGPVAERTPASNSPLHASLAEFLSQSPAEYVRMLKLKHAQFLLCNSVLSMEQVLCVTGMQELKSFARAYEVAFGETPSETRRQVGRLAQ